MGRLIRKGAAAGDILNAARATLTNATAKGAPWAALAADCGYYDQSHFSHEFREFSGLTPTGYHQVRTVFQNHVTFLQDP